MSFSKEEKKVLLLLMLLFWHFMRRNCNQGMKKVGFWWGACFCCLFLNQDGNMLVVTSLSSVEIPFSK